MPGPEESERLRGAAWLSSHEEPIDELGARAYHLWAKKALEGALQRLDGAGIPALVVKGMVLAYLLYEKPTDRPVVNVDLRVRPADLSAAVRALMAPPRGARLLVSSRVFGSAVVSLSKIQVDLETHIGPPFMCAVGIPAMLARAERTAEGHGFPHLRPELHDHALLLAVNLFKDRMLGGRWRLGDFERIARLPAFDPAVLRARATEARCGTLVHIVATHVAHMTGDERWRAIAAEILPARPDYAARVLATLREKRKRGLYAWRLELRASSDSRARRVATLATTGLRELEALVQGQR